MKSHNNKSISGDDHDAILDEIARREALDYDEQVQEDEDEDEQVEEDMEDVCNDDDDDDLPSEGDGNLEEDDNN